MGINVPKSMPPSFFATAASVFIFLVDAEVEMELFCKKRFISRPFKSLQCCATLVLTIESLYKTFQNFQAFKYNTSAEKNYPLRSYCKTYEITVLLQTDRESYS